MTEESNGAPVVPSSAPEAVPAPAPTPVQTPEAVAEPTLTLEHLTRYLGLAKDLLVSKVEAENFLKGAKFHLVVIPDSGSETTCSFDTSEAMINFIRGLDSHCAIRMFLGYEWHLTMDVPRRIIDHKGGLHDIQPRIGRINRSGRLDGAVIDFDNHQPAIQGPSETTPHE